MDRKSFLPKPSTGNLRAGSDDIRRHKWFKGIEWEEILRCQFKPPIVPELRHETDTRNFDPVSELMDSPVTFNLDDRALDMLELF